jgi:hypothetical protein
MNKNTVDSSVKVQGAWAKFVSFCKFFADYLGDYVDGRKYAVVSKLKQRKK